MQLPDIHKKPPEIALPLSKVGTVGVRMPIGYISLKKVPVLIYPVFDVFLDLPQDLKGIHVSRSYEVITDVLGKYMGKTYKLENVCVTIAKRLLEKHRYATRSEVKARGDAILERRTPKTESLSYETFGMMAKAIAERGVDGTIRTRRMIGVRLTGITACPCAKELVKKITQHEIEKLGLPKGKMKRVLDKIPVATHMQRAYGSLLIEIPEGVDIDATQLVQIVTDSMSASTFELLKRPDEAEVVVRAAYNPRFIEDCVRYMMGNVVKSFPELPDDVYVVFKAKSLESVHTHNLVAERATTLGEIRKALG